MIGKILPIMIGNFFPVMTGRILPITGRVIGNFLPVMTGRILPITVAVPRQIHLGVIGNFLPLSRPFLLVEDADAESPVRAGDLDVPLARQAGQVRAYGPHGEAQVLSDLLGQHGPSMGHVALGVGLLVDAPVEFPDGDADALTVLGRDASATDAEGGVGRLAGHERGSPAGVGCLW